MKIGIIVDKSKAYKVLPNSSLMPSDYWSGLKPVVESATTDRAGKFNKCSQKWDHKGILKRIKEWVRSWRLRN